MKKALLLLAIAASTLTAAAQKGSKAFGAQLVYGTKIENVGFGLKGQYFFTDNIRFEGSFNNYFKKNSMTMWELNANAHYVVNLGEKFRVYPLIGLTYANWGLSYDEERKGKIYVETDHSHRFGINFGVGAEYDLSSNLFATLEVKDQVVNNYGQVAIGLGVGYRF